MELPAPAARRSAIILLLLGGLALVILDADSSTWPQCLAALIAALVGFTFHRPLSPHLERLRHPSPRTATLIAAAAGVLATSYLISSAVAQGRGLFPKIHDEMEFLLQARLLSQGHLCLPAHPIGEFFETFYVLVKPVYAPVYFPGTALLYAPALLLGIAPWTLAALISGGIVALLYRIITHLIDGAAGLLAILLLLSLERYRFLSIMTMSYTVLLLLALAMTWAWLRCREHGQQGGWAILIGLCAGWALITRPLDAVCFIAPLGLALLLDPRGRRPATLALIALGAAPFLALQLCFDYSVTGHFFQTPWSSNQLTYPALHLGLSPGNLTTPSPSPLPQVRDLYAHVYLPQMRAFYDHSIIQTWSSIRLPALRHTTLPAGLLLLLIPVGWLGLRDPRRWVVWAVLPLFIIAYSFYPLFLDLYALMALAAVILNVLLGAQVLADAFPRTRVITFLALAILALGSLPQLNPRIHDGSVDTPTLDDVNQKLAHLDHTPAVVLFRYHPGNDVNEEPVYNLDVASPDDAPVLRAQDLGPTLDPRIFTYYAQHHPERYFYLYDRNDGTLYPLGPARDAQQRALLRIP